MNTSDIVRQCIVGHFIGEAGHLISDFVNLFMHSLAVNSCTVSKK